MLPIFVSLILIIAVVDIWVIAIQRKLAVLNENRNSAMNQMAIQLNGRFEALILLLNIARECTGYESEDLIENIRETRDTVAEIFDPKDLLKQEAIISEILSKIIMLSKQHAELGENPEYIKMIGAVDTFGNMIDTSCLIYNDSVSKLNREIRVFPNSIIAKLLGFKQRDYLERTGR